MRRFEARLCLRFAQDRPGADRDIQPLEVLQIQRLQLEGVAEQPTRLIGDQDATWLGARLQARGQIGRIADDGLLLRRPLADEVSDDDDPGRDTDAGPQDFCVGCLQICDGLGQIKSSPHSPFGIVFMGAGESEISEHAVAHELCDEAVVPYNHAGAGVLIRPNDLPHVLGIKPSRHCGRSDKITEQDR